MLGSAVRVVAADVAEGPVVGAVAVLTEVVLTEVVVVGAVESNSCV